MAKVKLRMEVTTLNIFEVAFLVATFGCDNYQKKAGEIYCRRNMRDPWRNSMHSFTSKAAYAFGRVCSESSNL